MKRFLSLIIAFFILSGVLAQRNVPLNCNLDIHETKTVSVVLEGPYLSCQSIPLKLNVSYQPAEELVTVEVKCDNDNEAKYVKSPRKKDRITHLWFPIKWNDIQYKYMGFKRYFKDDFSSKVVLENPMREQIANCKSSDYIRPAFQFINGDLQNPMKEDIFFAIHGERKIVMKVKVSDLDKPMVMKINNVIPLRAKSEYSMESNKFFLKYISNSYTITFNLPEDKCARQYSLIAQYQNWNKQLSDDIDAMFDLGYNKTGIIRAKLLMLDKYMEARRGISATKCEKLRQEFEAFKQNYDNLDEGLITRDSLQIIFEELNAPYDQANTDNNYGNGKACKELKKKAEKYYGLELDEAAYKDFPGAYDTVGMINSLIEMIDYMVCKGGGSRVVVNTPPVSSSRVRCQFDEARMKNAMREINNLQSRNYLNGEQNRTQFDRIKNETDNYLKNLSESCKLDNKGVIDSYYESISTYLKFYKK